MSLAAISNGFAPNSTKPNKKKQVIVAASDTRSQSDAIARRLRLSRPFSDTRSFSDSMARSLIFSRRNVDSSSFSETMARLLHINRSQSDTEAFSENQVIQQIRFLVDSVSFSELMASNVALGRGSSDTVAFEEGLGTPANPSSILVDLLRLQTESTPYTENITTNFIGSRAMSDAEVLTETAAVLRAFLRTLVDIVSIADSAAATKSLLCAIADTLSVDDLPAKTALQLRSFLDSFAFSESLDSNVVVDQVESTTVQFAEAVGTFKDPATVIVDLLRLDNEQQSYSESLIGNVTFIIALADTQTFSDVVQGVHEVEVEATDSFFFHDYVQVGPLGAKGIGTIVIATGAGSVTISTGGGTVVRVGGQPNVKPNAGSGNTSTVSGEGKVN